VRNDGKRDEKDAVIEQFAGYASACIAAESHLHYSQYGILLRKASMGVSNLVGLTAGCVLALAAGLAGAAPVYLQFPEYTGPSVPAGPYPQPPVEVGTETFAIPPGEVVIAATVSGFWGAPGGDPNSTAGVDVMLDGVTVAQCAKDDPSCYDYGVPMRPWTYTLTPAEMSRLNDGIAKLTVVQTSELKVNIGVTTVKIETGPPAGIPATSPLGLLALFGAMSAVGALMLRRRGRS
jgi:hypothetical protein